MSVDLRKERPDDPEATLARLEQAGAAFEDDANCGSCVSWTRMLVIHIWDGLLGPPCDL